MRTRKPLVSVTHAHLRRSDGRSTSGTLRQVQDLMDRLDLLELQRLLQDDGIFPDGERTLRLVGERWKTGDDLAAADLDGRLVAGWRHAG
jgi:hypothetical protein